MKISRNREGIVVVQCWVNKSDKINKYNGCIVNKPREVEWLKRNKNYLSGYLRDSENFTNREGVVVVQCWVNKK